MRRIRCVWAAAGGLGAAGLFVALGVRVPFDPVRFVALSYGTVVVLFAVLLAAVYSLRFSAWQRLGQQRDMIRPWLVWGMGFSYVLPLVSELTRLAVRIHNPEVAGSTPALLISVTFALFWLDQITARQFRHLPSTERPGRGRE